MPAYLSTELAGSANLTAAPVGYKPAATVYNGRLKRLRASFTLASQTTSDTLVVGSLPAGASFAFLALTSSVSLGTSTLGVGVSGATGKYRPSVVFTTTDNPVLFGAAVRVADAPLAAEESVFCTIGVASLPASGTLVVDIYYSMPT